VIVIDRQYISHSYVKIAPFEPGPGFGRSEGRNLHSATQIVVEIAMVTRVKDIKTHSLKPSQVANVMFLGAAVAVLYLLLLVVCI